MTADARSVRTRLFNVVPAASFQMEKLLGLVDVVFSAEVPTAAVECSCMPRLLLNPDFVELYCQRDGHLLMLVLHELQHVILGHTRLFPRITPAHNLAFDAVINAMLSRQFPSEAGFFQLTNGWESFPGRLLRPPPGWPDAPEPLPADASDAERELHALLYEGGDQQVTYHELFALLLTELQTRAVGGAMLLGDHSGPDGSGGLDERAGRDDVMRSVLRRIVEGWPPPDRRLSGRDTGRGVSAWNLDTQATPEQALRRSLRRLLARVGILGAASHARRRLTHVQTTLAVGTVRPQPRDRRAHAWTLLYGKPPLLWRGEPQPTAHAAATPGARLPRCQWLDAPGPSGSRGCPARAAPSGRHPALRVQHRGRRDAPG